MQAHEVIDFIVNWMVEYCHQAKMKGFVIGVSGGIDSAVTSTLCALTQMEVLALSLPIYQNKDQMHLAEAHMAWLKKKFPDVKGITVDLSPAMEGIENTLPIEIQDDLTLANTRSRLRMTTLYAFASHHSMLVVGTGNKIEDFGVGFFTKYGDGGVDISPIADLMKSEVYTLGRELGIEEAILNVPPTDGLWMDNRTDEEQLGTTYDELEWAMKFEGSKEQESLLSDRQKRTLSIYRQLHNKNSHKTDPIPVARIPESLR